MPDFVNVLLIALLPITGNQVGVVAAEWIRVSPRALGMLLHGTAGVAIAVVGVEILPLALPGLSVGLLLLAFCSGALVSVLLARGVSRSPLALESRGLRAWMIYLAVAADLLSDGLMIGVGFTVSAGLGLLLGLAQVIANLPGGFAAGANFRRNRISRRTRVLAGVAFPLPVFAGASLGYWLLRDAPVQLSHAALVFTAAILLLTTVEDLVPEADAPQARRWATTAAFTAGFVFFTILSMVID